MSDDDARRKLWDAVNQITQPSARRLERDTDAEWTAAVTDEHEWERRRGDALVCDVVIYRATLERLQAATVAYGKIPCLWQQATWALTTGSEKAEGGSAPLRERSPADLDLMETMLTIRESMAWQLPGRGITPKKTLPEQMRQLAAYIVTSEPQHVEWWAYRFGQWARLLATHLRALESGPKPRRLRAPCPVCKSRQILVGPGGHPTGRDDPEAKVAPPIVIDFENGWIRAAECQACGSIWWRGDALGELASLLDTPTADGVAS